LVVCQNCVDKLQQLIMGCAKLKESIFFTVKVQGYLTFFSYFTNHYWLAIKFKPNCYSKFQDILLFCWDNLNYQVLAKSALIVFSYTSFHIQFCKNLSPWWTFVNLYCPLEKWKNVTCNLHCMVHFIFTLKGVEKYLHINQIHNSTFFSLLKVCMTPLWRWALTRLDPRILLTRSK